MRVAWLGLGALAALSACAPYPGTYDTGYGYSYAPAPVGESYYGGGYYGGGYGAPYYTQVPVESTIVLGGGRRWNDDHWRRGRDRREYYQQERGRPSYARPQYQQRPAPQPAAIARPAPPPPRPDFGRPGGGSAERGGFNPANPTAQGGADR